MSSASIPTREVCGRAFKGANKSDRRLDVGDKSESTLLLLVLSLQVSDCAAVPCSGYSTSVSVVVDSVTRSSTLASSRFMLVNLARLALLPMRAAGEESTVSKIVSESNGTTCCLAVGDPISNGSFFTRLGSIPASHSSNSGFTLRIALPGAKTGFVIVAVLGCDSKLAKRECIENRSVLS